MSNAGVVYRTTNGSTWREVYSALRRRARRDSRGIAFDPATPAAFWPRCPTTSRSRATCRTCKSRSNAPQWAAVFDIGSVPQTPIGPL